MGQCAGDAERGPQPARTPDASLCEAERRGEDGWGAQRQDPPH